MFRKSKFLTLICILTVSAVLMLVAIISFCLSGALSAEKPTLVFRSNSARIVYDGSTLSDNGYSLLSGKLKEGHKAKVNVTGSQEGVGRSENRLYVTIIDEMGADVTADYNVVIEHGILEIKPITLKFKTEGAVKEYDGSPLMSDNCTLTNPEALMNGDRVRVVVTGSQTAIGTSFNTCSVKIIDLMGNDVSYKYDFENEYGLLVVSKINLTVQSYSYTTQYPNVAVCNEYGYDDWVLLEGHRIHDVKISGRQEGIGSSPNTIDYVRIVDEVTGKSVDEYYNVIRSEGTLKVESNSYSDDQPLGYVTSSLGGKIYLKDQSFGEYLGNFWAEAKEYPYAYNNTFSADYLTGTAIKNSAVSHTVNSIRVTSLNGGLGLPYYMAIGLHEKHDQKSDVLYNVDPEEYTVNSYIMPDRQLYYHSIPDLSEFEKNYRNYVYANYTYIPEDTLAYMKSVIDQKGFYGNDLDTIYRVAEFIKNSAYYDLDFDPALEEEGDIAVAFLSEYKRGVCRHYATAATALYRAMGIPARYTEGFAVSTLSGMRAAITPAMRHAWVEVYLDGIGWMMVEVTGSRSEVHSDVVNITVNNASVKYGNAIPKITYRGFESYAAEGYRFEPVFSEVPYEYGKHSVSIVDYKIYDPHGEDVTENFEFSQRTGTVQIYRDVISVNNFAPDGSDTYEFVFDGIEHKINSVRCTTSGFERMGLKLVLVSTESLVSVGEEPIRYEIQLLDASGKDVTAEYKVIKEYAKMKIYPRPIEITIDDVSAPFSDSEIKASSYKLTGGSLADGHTISSIVFGGSQTEIGCSESWVSEITIKNRSGISVEHNYSISYIPGELRITP